MKAEQKRKIKLPTKEWQSKENVSHVTVNKAPAAEPFKTAAAERTV